MGRTKIDLKTTIATIPQIWRGLLIGFIAIFGIRITYPIVSQIIDIFNPGIMKTTAILIYWFMYITVLYFFTWVAFFQKKDQTQTQ